MILLKLIARKWDVGVWNASGWVRILKWGILEERAHRGDTRVNGMILLKLIFRKWDVGVWTASGWVRIGKWGKLEERDH
jgi:hypothetical protein